MAAKELTLPIRCEMRNQLPRGTTCLQAKNTIVSLSLWPRLRIKKIKNVRAWWQIMLCFSEMLGCAGAGRCTPPPSPLPQCQEPHCNICEHADQFLFASVFFGGVTPPVNLYQKPFLGFTVRRSQFRLEDWGGGGGGGAWLFQSRRFIWGFWLSPHKSCLVHRRRDAAVPLNQYTSSYFTRRRKYRLKSQENLLVHLAAWFLKGLAPQNPTFR